MLTINLNKILSNNRTPIWLLLSILVSLVLFSISSPKVDAKIGNNCAPASGVLCAYNTTYYTPTVYTQSACNPPYQSNYTPFGRGDSCTSDDQPTLQWLDNMSYNFETQGVPQVPAGGTVNLLLGYDTYSDANGDKTITWTNIVGAKTSVSSLTASGGITGECIRGHPWDTPTIADQPYVRGQSAYPNTGSYSGCVSGDGNLSASWVDSPLGTKIQNRHQLKINLQNVTSNQTFCLRTHVSIMKGSHVLPFHNNSTPNGSIDSDDYANQMGVMGKGRSNYPDLSITTFNDSMCFQVVPPSLPTAQPPYLGVDDPATCPVISGFAYDLDNVNAATRVDIYADAPAAPGRTPVWSESASEPRADVNSVLGVPGNHGFQAVVPQSLIDGGIHTFYVYAIDESNTVTGVGPAPGITGHAGNGHILGTDPIAINTAGCPKAYKYSFSPQAGYDKTGTEENPGTITFHYFNGYATEAFIPSCMHNITVTHDIFVHKAGDPPGVTTSLIGGPISVTEDCTGYERWDTHDTSYTPPLGYQAGDSFCVSVSVNPSQGYADANGYQIGAPTIGLRQDTQCLTIKNKPFFNAYGSGVSSGGSFDTCNGGGMLAGWNNNTSGTGYGAGTRLSAIALVNIVGFASGQIPSATQSIAYGQTFARAGLPAGSITSSLDSPKLGGSFGGTHCLDPLVEPTDAQPLASDTYQINSLPGLGARSPYKRTGDLKLNTASASGVNPGQNTSIFVTGDVYISNNITYGTGWTIDNIPSFVLKATGNIYIDPQVTRLDGRYVAQGKIYTCASNLRDVMPPIIQYGECANQLTVTGSFSATQINLMRTFGSLRDTNGAGSCSSAAGAIRSSMRSCAAEVFDFSPEIYLADPVVGPPTSNLKEYESITSLPPVL